MAMAERVLALIERAFAIAMNLILGTMFAINIANIVLRSLTGEALAWVFPWTVVLFVWLSFIGFFVVMRRGADVTVEFLYKHAPARMRRFWRHAVDAVIAAVMLVILVQAPQTLAAQQSAIEMVGLARYVLSAPLFLSAALILVHVVLGAVRRIVGTAAEA